MSAAPPINQPGAPQLTKLQLWGRLLWALTMLFFFLVAIRGMGEGFKGLGRDTLESFFSATSNPFVGLVVGILGTTLVQSSSVTTSMIVAMVAAPSNPLPVANAIPMVMGANIGTTVTNTIVALAHMGRPNEFRRAFAAATCHDFFNFMAVAVLLPLEMMTGFLHTASASITGAISGGGGGGGKLPNPIKGAVKAVYAPIEDGVHALLGEGQIASVVIIAVSMLTIFIMLGQIVKALRSIAGPRLQTFLSTALDSNPYIGIVVGIVITVSVQSSSITTSLMVPLAGAGLVSLQQVFPISLGANLGTTITALLASMAAPAETAALATQIATVHVLFNLMGVLMVYPIPRIRMIPLNGATWLAELAVRSRKMALLYVLSVFYGLPAVLIAVSKMLS